MTGSAFSPLLPEQTTIGILGGGQLGRMSAMAAQRMGYRVVALTPETDSPISTVAHQTLVAPYTDTEALRQLASVAQVVTVEFENVPTEALTVLREHGALTHPGPLALATAQNRLREKQFFKTHQLPTPQFVEVDSLAALEAALIDLGTPAVLKTAGFGYDGKGQVKINTPAEARQAWETLSGGATQGVKAILEAWITFEREVSLISARNPQGETVHYGLVHNVHEHHILHTSRVPFHQGGLQAEAERISTAILDALGYVGLLCVEYFVTPQGTLLINEMAPRPHNSGHLTIEASLTSQFEQHIRAICGLPLGPTRWRVPTAAMRNLLGDVWQDGPPAWAAILHDAPDIAIHLYGKREARPGRKMGHLTVCATSELALESKLAQLERRLTHPVVL